MFNLLKNHPLIWLAPLSLLLYNLAFNDTAIFWYMYSFALLVLMSAALVYTKIFDELPTWKSLLYGIAAGLVTYGVFAGGFQLLRILPGNGEGSVSSFLSIFAPTSIWHYLLLMFIIVPGEEIFWRGFVQQQLKKYVPAALSIAVSAVLFGIALGLGDFFPGVLAGVAAGIILGILYEWKRSMPSLIIAHLVMLVLLFIVVPL